jgi:hypothetical protein
MQCLVERDELALWSREETALNIVLWAIALILQRPVTELNEFSLPIYAL